MSIESSKTRYQDTQGEDGGGTIGRFGIAPKVAVERFMIVMKPDLSCHRSGAASTAFFKTGIHGKVLRRAAAPRPVSERDSLRFTYGEDGVRTM